MCPSDRWPAVARRQSVEPLPVVGAVWQTRCQLVALQSRTNDDRYVGLRPLAADGGRDIRCVQKSPLSMSPVLQNLPEKKGLSKDSPRSPS